MIKKTTTSCVSFVADLRDAIHNLLLCDAMPFTTCCLFAVVMHRDTFQWKYENAALDTS